MSPVRSICPSSPLEEGDGAFRSREFCCGSSTPFEIVPHVRRTAGGDGIRRGAWESPFHGLCDQTLSAWPGATGGPALSQIGPFRRGTRLSIECPHLAPRGSPGLETDTPVGRLFRPTARSILAAPVVQKRPHSGAAIEIDSLSNKGTGPCNTLCSSVVKHPGMESVPFFHRLSVSEACSSARRNAPSRGSERRVPGQDGRECETFSTAPVCPGELGRALKKGGRAPRCDPSLRGSGVPAGAGSSFRLTIRIKRPVPHCSEGADMARLFERPVGRVRVRFPGTRFARANPV